MVSYREPPTGNLIRKYRRDAGLTQAEAAAVVGVSRRTWLRWEHGDFNMPDEALGRFLKHLRGAK